MPVPKTYEDWLALSDAQKQAIKFQWNAYAREGIGFPLTAAGRLAISSSVPVLDGQVGTYHGGEYVLNMFVAESVVGSLPGMLEQTFEGFRVVWLPAPTA
ncbi:MAG TPA: hypothetical protein VH518_04340 [Tepidisphaeraceae bacterium]